MSEELDPIVTHLYAERLKRRGEELRDFPLYCQQAHVLPDVPEHEATTDFFGPLQ